MRPAAVHYSTPPAHYSYVLWGRRVAPVFDDPLHWGHVCGQPLLSLAVPGRLVAHGALPMRSEHVPP